VSDAAYATFGSGGAEPYANALRRDDEVLYLLESRSHSLASSRAMDISRWNDDADVADLSLLEGIAGSVLDIGCGPGRMVQAAMGLGLFALGIDVSDAAVRIARGAGLPVIKRSVFQPLPGEGGWQAALLVDGNIGIGGDPTGLLRRCAELIAPDGGVLVEVSAEPFRDHTYSGTVVDIRGRRSAAFPWAEIGRAALAGRASLVGLRLVQDWEAGGRSFCRFATA
jgi:SAM-dependent methyltransferase